jgi:hypothetical protein
MKRDDIITAVLNMTLKSCYEDSVYNDNTLHDLLLFGFKGLSNMTDEELKNELEMIKTWHCEDEEISA